LQPTETHIIGALSGTLDEELEIGIVTLSFIEVTVGIYSFEGSKWVTGKTRS